MNKIQTVFEKIINRISIKYSLLIIFITVFLIPFITLSIIFVSYVYNYMMDWEIHGIQTSLKATQASLNHDLAEVQLLSDRIYVNNQLNTILERNYTDIQELYSSYSNLHFLENYILLYPQVDNIRIYSENQTLLDNSFLVKTDDKIIYSKWYTDAVNAKGQAFWCYKEDSITHKTYLCLVRSLWSSSGLFLGILCININPQTIKNLIKTPSYESLIFIDENLFISSIPDLSYEEMNIFKTLARASSLEVMNIQQKWFRGQQYGITESRFKAPGNIALKLIIFYVFPMNYLYRHFASIIVLSVIIIFIFALLAMTVFLMFSSYLKQRFGRIQNEVSHLVEQEFEIAPSIGGKDEFADIYETIYKMSEDIKRLIGEVYEQNLEKQMLKASQNEIRFKMLSAQINPHFLFNAIETIRMKALSSGDKDIASMLRMLASLLRYNLSVKGKPVPLEQELEAVNNYLKIQQMRFGNRVSYELLVTGDQTKVQILPLIIQPLVENSFVHGLEDRLSGGMIYLIINILELKNKKISVNIIVKDNGCGIDEKKLVELQKSLKKSKIEESSGSIGIENVNSRIKLYYGNKSGLKIESKKGEGTSVSLNFIINTKKQNEEK